MRIKKAVCAALTLTMFFGTAALAKDNIYAYNKFISTILGQQLGYCDFTASFAGHESEYENVNDYFAGLVSAWYDDIDADFDNELITVDTQHGVAVYQMEENGVVFLGSIDFDMIANYGNSYTNVFTIPVGLKQYIGAEHYDEAINEYTMLFYELDPETDEFGKVLEIRREDNEDGTEEKVWAGDKTFYSYTNGGGLITSINPDNYGDCAFAAEAALKTMTPDAAFKSSFMRDRINGRIDGEDFRLVVNGIVPKSYIRATGVRFTETPMVVFEDKSLLDELRIKPDIVTVVLDGQTLQFPTQDPMVIEMDGTYRTLVPMRTIFEALGADVRWIDENGVQSIVATTEDTTINMTINDKKYFVNGEEKELDVPAQLINDKTLVPIRAISESLGCYVGWDQDAKTVIIQSHLDN